MAKSGLSPQYIMRASLARHLAEVAKEQADAIAKGETVYRHQSVDAQRSGGESEIECLGWSEDYAEPGYTAGERGVLTADWNYFHRDITDLLERAGFECEWSDEWTTCDDCGKLVRTSGDCYDWQPAYITQNDCATICLNCVDWAEYLESIEDNPRTACMRRCNPAKYGYVQISESGEYENGWHPGQTDNPKEIFAKLQAEGEEHLVFRISETSQFYIRFEVWQRAVTLERVEYRLAQRFEHVYNRAQEEDSDEVEAEYQDAKRALQLVKEITAKLKDAEVTQ